MKKVSVILTLLVLFSVLLTGCKTAQPTTYNLEVTVKDEDGKPVEGADVYLTSGDYQTDSKGMVSLTKLEEPETYITIEKDGYISIEEDLTLSIGDNKKSFILKKEKEVIETPDNLLGIANLNSYSYYMELGTTKENIETVIEGFVEKPNKLRLMTKSDNGNDMFEVIAVDGQAKIRTDDMDWVDAPGEYSDTYGKVFFSQSEFVQDAFKVKDLYKIENLGSEVLNGFPVIKYRVTLKEVKDNKLEFYAWIVTSGLLKDVAIKIENFSYGADNSYLMVELKTANKPLNIKLP